jgi:hypothetical protein
MTAKVFINNNNREFIPLKFFKFKDKVVVKLVKRTVGILEKFKMSTLSSVSTISQGVQWTTFNRPHSHTIT